MFVHTYHPGPILLNFNFFQIRWYGFFIVLAIMVNFFIAQCLFKKYKLSADLLYDLGFYLLLFGLVGARLWHVLSEFDYYWQYPLDIFKIWQGGLAIHGAMFGGIITILFYVRRRKMKNFLILLDIFVPLLTLGQAIGRWGNYFNQELYGRPTNLPWGIPIDSANRLLGWGNFDYFQPVFLYESLWCLLMFIFLIVLHLVRIKE